MMAEPRQKPIPVTRDERQTLNARKQRYEKSTGDIGDWGNFLGNITLLGLAAVGIYKLVKTSARSRQSVDIQCPECSEAFVVAVPGNVSRAINIDCPHCSEEFVIYLD